jgi:hypothetical protein
MKKTSVIIMETKYVLCLLCLLFVFRLEDLIIHGLLLHAANTNYAIQWYNDCE